MTSLLAREARWALGLRIVAGLLLVAGVVASGVRGSSPWIVLPWAAGFTACHAVGRWRQWQLAFAAGRGTTALAGLPVTLLVQTVLVVLLYLIGRGAGALAGIDAHGAGLLPDDGVLLASVVGLAFVLGVIVAGVERSRPTANPIDERPHAEIAIVDAPVDPATFFDGIHFLHGRYEGPERTYDGTPNAQSAGDAARIVAAEQRLGITLPERLRALYRLQNGGSVVSLCVLKPGVTVATRFEDILTPFSGYSDLLPLESLRSVHDHATDYADPDDPDQAEAFPEGCERMIVLARWYRETLFLDYRGGAQPRVVFVDFDSPGAPQGGQEWADFDTFFAALRRFETL